MPRLIAPLLVAVLVLSGRTAHAAVFTVAPTRIVLTASTASSLLALKNESPEPLRLQIKALAWQQTAAGDMQLTDTVDLIVFPTLLTLQPGEERKVRVAHATTVAGIEKTYRVFVEELPPASRDAQGSSVRILTRMGIPVFLQPVAPAPKATLGDVGLAGGRLTFRLQNTGNAHFIPDRVRVRAFTATGDTLNDQTVASWYVLAGGTRQFALAFPPDVCGRIRSALVEVQIAETLLETPLTTPGGACAP
jgi:fimbrial chaperone protein